MKLLAQNIADKLFQNEKSHTVIPQKNVKPWKDTKAHSLERNELLRTVKYFGKTTLKNRSNYYLRSLVETKMHCIKFLRNKLSAKHFFKFDQCGICENYYSE